MAAAIPVGAAVPPVIPPVPPPAIAVFALTPAVAVQGVVDLTTNVGRKLYESATKKVAEELYDCKPEGLYQFLQSVSNRARAFGWDDPVNGILQIPEDAADPQSVTDNLIENYGRISLTDIRAFEATYLHQPVRPAQDAWMLYQCLMSSISKEGKDKITIWNNQYTVGGHLSGNLLLKIIIRESYLNTNATTSNIRKKLSSLDTYILTIDSDITRFNIHVSLLIDSLTARGESTQDLLINLFKGYQAATDRTFVEYIGRKLERYEEGEIVTTDALMEQADNKYKLLKESGAWNAPSENEEKILALQAEIKHLKKAKKDGGKPFAKKAYDKKPYDKKKPPIAQLEKPSWFFKEPKEDDLRKPRMWNDKSWYYCCPKTGGKCDGQYRRHKPADCEGKAHKFVPRTGADNKRKASDDKPSDDKKLKLAKAYQATLDNMISYDDMEE
jgi:hypothetical protein